MSVPDTHIQQKLSLAYMSAVVSSAGLALNQKSADDFGIDADVSYVVEYNGYVQDAGVALAVQLKSTTNFEHANGVVKYDLKRDAYDRLLIPCLQSKILVLFTMPKTKDDWLNCSHEHLLLKRSAYYLPCSSLPNHSVNKSSIRISIPESNLLTPDSLKALVHPGLIKLGL